MTVFRPKASPQGHGPRPKSAHATHEAAARPVRGEEVCSGRYRGARASRAGKEREVRSHQGCGVAVREELRSGEVVLGGSGELQWTTETGGKSWSTVEMRRVRRSQRRKAGRAEAWSSL
jgi:hypothetical protein